MRKILLFIRFISLFLNFYKMARLPQGILGGVLGKVGNVVGSSWKGIPILKSRPLSVANPRTTKQVAQRTKMSNVVEFAKAILASVIKPLNDRFAQQASGYNDFVSRNIHLFENAEPSPAENLSISVGKMAKVTPEITTADNNTKTVEVGWTTTLPDAFAAATDLAYVVLQNATTGEIVPSGGLNTRADSSIIVTLAENLKADDILHVWLAFRRVDGTVVSNTGYAYYSVE